MTVSNFSVLQDCADYGKLGALLNSPCSPLRERFRALFTLKNIGGRRAVELVAGSLFTDDSALFKHELAYVLGQMRDPSALPFLERVLGNVEEDAMVRHEAAEAMGAIGCESSLAILERYRDDGEACVRETCELAIENIKTPPRDTSDARKFETVDPAPALDSTNAPELESILLDSARPLFERYRAMFALRDLGTPAAIAILAKGFADGSALFRHEIAYVFGQLQSALAIPALHAVLADRREAAMVRHEAAEALGSIAAPECLPILREYAGDVERVVRESCLVALDMLKYEQEAQQFNFVDDIIAK